MTCARGDWCDALLSFTSGERTCRHPPSADPWQDRGPQVLRWGVWGWCHSAWASCLAAAGLEQTLSSLTPLHPRRSSLPSQEPEDKLGPLGWEWGTLQTALSSPRLLTPQGDLCHPNDANLPTPGAPIPTSSSAPHTPCYAKGGFSL